MADYDFRSLSSYDFELLARDLLQVTLDKQLESFSPGPDSGIDFRYRDNATNLIVQAKHYAESGYAALLSALRHKERRKIDSLNPTRYILVTSLPLTPRKKAEILEILKPHCLQLSDIYGREDLNNILSQHDDIERRHFKLWLTSESVLRRVLQAGIFSDSDAHLDRARLRLRRYVYFDDFLGKTSLEKLQKNEDQRVIELMEEVSENQNWRFILTTREYILNTAKLRYEAFAHPSSDFKLCVINLDDYVRSIRAKILYNHIYFSDLPKPHKLALLHNRGYETILRHRNYNPRVIEYMTQARHACTVVASVYMNEFIDSLEHPARIWDHAFRHQISEAARHVLQVLATLPDELLLNDLETAFWKFYRLRQKKFGFNTASGDWNNALRQLDGSFIATKRVGRDLVVAFHNPSIRDYLEDFLSNSEGDIEDLMHGAHFYEQYTRLWSGQRGNRYNGVESRITEFLHEFQSSLLGPSATTLRRVGSDGRVEGVGHSPVSFENRARFVVQVVNELKREEGDQFLGTAVSQLEELWKLGNADKEDFVQLLQDLTARGLRTEDQAFRIAQDCLSAHLADIKDFRALAMFVTSYPQVLSNDEMANLRKHFEEFAAEYSDGWGDDDPDWLQQVASDIDFVGEGLDVEVESLTSPLYYRAEEIEGERASRYDPDDDDRGWQSSQGHREDVDSMFEGLRYELGL